MSHHHHVDHETPINYTRRRFLVAGAVAAIPTAAWYAIAGANDDDPVSGAATDASTITERTAPAPAGQQQAATGGSPPSTVTPIVEIPTLTHALAQGAVDPAVGLLQQRLTELAFDPGPIDDYFGAATTRSVWAFQKLVAGIAREQADGTVDAGLWDRLHGPVTISARRTPGGTHLEVYLPEQVAVLYQDGEARVVSHVSSGEGIEWCDEVIIDLEDGTQETKGICGLSVTPGGVYHFERKVEGWRNAKLGRLYKPTYFNYGIAIHGASNVPSYPASRGCVRFPMHIAEYIQDLVAIGDSVFVFDGVEEPEHYGAQPMIFDWPDPDYTTTTTSTTTSTTTTTTSTVPPAAVATTTEPAPTTTTSTTTSTVPTTTTSTVPGA